MWNLGEYRKHPQRLADHLPWATLIAPGVMLNKDGSLQKTIAFRGPDLDSSTPYELVAARARMNNVLRRLGSHWCVHVEASRRLAHVYPASDFPNPVAAMIDQERRDSFTADALHFESQCFITFTYLPPAEGMTRLGDFFIDRPNNKVEGRVSYRAHFDHFLGQVDQIVNLMASFMPEVHPLDDGETLTYLHSCISDRRLTVAVPDVPFYLDEMITDRPLAGGLSPRLGRLFLKTVSVRAYVNRTLPCLLDRLNELPIEYRWIGRYLPMDKTDATRQLNKLRRQWFAKRNPPRKDGTADENAIRPSGPIESVKNLPQDYSFDVTRLGARYDGSSNRSAAPATGPAGPSAEDRALAHAMRELAEQRRKLLEQQQKEEQAALDSPLLFGGAKSSTASTGTTPTTMPTVVMLGPDSNRAIGLSAAGNNQDNSATGVGPSGGANQTHQQEKEAFLTQGAAVEPYLSKPLLNPISKYELKAGSVIPGALVTAINTDLPGEVIGQVTENVFDSVTGEYLLIPQGSKLLGKYQSLVTNGQNRALVVWQRLIYPNGNSIVLDGMPGTDESGAAGLQDKVDYHLDKLAEGTALSTALAYAGNLARNPNSSSGNNGQDVIGDTVAQQANRIGEKIIDRELDVQPTITIRQGWPLRVLVNKDMILEPYVP